MEYLFALSGAWVGFRVDRYVFDTDCNCIGWLPYETPEVFAPNGTFVGRIGPGGRLFVPVRVDRRIPPPPPKPPRPAKPPRPPFQPQVTGPPGATDVVINRR